MPENEAAEAPAPRDEYEKNLDTLKGQLQSCQEEHGVESCFPCDKVIGCELRNTYVNAVYASMNKGETGGFDF